MKPIEIPDDVADKWARLGWRKVTVGAPEEQPDPENPIRPVDALVGISGFGAEFNMLIQLDDGDLEMLRLNEGRFWLSINSRQLPPFAVHIFGGPDSNETLEDAQVAALLEATTGEGVNGHEPGREADYSPPEPM